MTVGAKPVPRVLRIPILAVLIVGAAYLGAGLGVAGGAHLHEKGEALIGEAEQFWLNVGLLLCVVLGFFRPTRWLGVTMLAAYVFAVAVGYAAGYRWGNFMGWHPD